MEILGDILGFVGNAASGGLIGGLLRLAPEVLKIFQSKADRQFELDMRRLDWQIAKEQGEQKIRELDAAGGWEAAGKQLEALQAALAAQGKPTGIWWVDAINALVRPGITWYFAGLYGASKVALFWIAYKGGAGVAQATLLLWTPADTQAFFGILGFWFVGRVYEGSAQRPR